MKEFMFIYQGGDPDWAINATPEQMAELMALWQAWMEKLAASDQLVSGGAPLHYSGKRLDANKMVTDIAAVELKELVSGYSIVRAENIDDAVAIAQFCPIFESPGVTVEVREVVQMG
ncbi:YCII-related domain protein [Grimontia celer]|uniref:YCII-related domain protein n=1 Tax=Grimontia celer TaxID=1796497 RepID=A0A128F9Y4_9GAMM|nr:YciI family protein [Grimontia celer]CZF83116.1 YCII-related domain protein [Grimontia celer]